MSVCEKANLVVGAELGQRIPKILHTLKIAGPGLQMLTSIFIRNLQEIWKVVFNHKQ